MVRRPGTHLRLLHEGLLAPAHLSPQQLQGRAVLQGPGTGLLGGLWKSPWVSPTAVGSVCAQGRLESGGAAEVRSHAVIPDNCPLSCQAGRLPYALTQARAVQLECSGHRGRNCCPGPRRAPSCSRRSWFCLF